VEQATGPFALPCMLTWLAVVFPLAATGFGSFSVANASLNLASMSFCWWLSIVPTMINSALGIASLWMDGLNVWTGGEQISIGFELLEATCFKICSICLKVSTGSNHWFPGHGYEFQPRVLANSRTVIQPPAPPTWYPDHFEA